MPLVNFKTKPGTPSKNQKLTNGNMSLVNFMTKPCTLMKQKDKRKLSWRTLSLARNMYKTFDRVLDHDILVDTFVAFVRNGIREKIYQAIFTLRWVESGDPVARMEVQNDKTYKQHLTIQTIDVDESYQRRGIARKCIKALKEASVKVGRVAHVESVHNEHMDTLLLSEDFYPSDDGYCYEWKPLTPNAWVVEVSTSFQVEQVPSDVSNYQGCVVQLTDVWKEAIPGMENFPKHARWFEPETDLEKISVELGIPQIVLKDFRVDKGCFGMSSFFTELYKDFYVIEGLAIDPSLGLLVDHACLCRIDKGKVYVFDLVRRKPLFMYGVIVRPIMKRRMSLKCKDTWAGYSVINGLNYIKNEEGFWEE